VISRQWRGLARSSDAERYVRHLREETIPLLRSIRGFVDAAILRRPVAQGVEFLVVTRWHSMEAIEQFAGADPDVAVVPENVQRMMIEYDRTVRHYEVVE